MYIKIFLALFFITLVFPGLDFFYYMLSLDLEFIKKITYNSILFVCALHLLNKTISLSFEVILFITFSLMALALGLYNHGFINYSVLHIYAFLNPIIMICFGISFFKTHTQEHLVLLKRLLHAAILFNIIFVILYILFQNVWYLSSHYGFGTSLALLSAYILSRGNYLYFFFIFFLDIFTGKRTSFFAMTSLFFINKRFFLGKLNFQNLILGSLFPVALVFIYFNIDEYEVLRRFAFIRDIDFEDGVSIMMATGGRATEVLSIVSHLGDDIVKWVFGSGIGVSYDYIDPRLSYSIEKIHYSHFSPFAYILVFGSVFTFFLYCSLFTRFFKGLKFYNDYFFLSFSVLFVTSFFGSILFSSPIPWFFTGVLIEMIRSQNSIKLH